MRIVKFYINELCNRMNFARWSDTNCSYSFGAKPYLIFFEFAVDAFLVFFAETDLGPILKQPVNFQQEDRFAKIEFFKEIKFLKI